MPASPFPIRKEKYQSSNKMNVSSNRIRLWWEINLYTSNSFVEKNGDNVSTCPPGSPFTWETRCFLHRALLVFIATPSCLLTDLCSVIVTHCRFLPYLPWLLISATTNQKKAFHCWVLFVVMKAPHAIFARFITVSVAASSKSRKCPLAWHCFGESPNDHVYPEFQNSSRVDARHQWYECKGGVGNICFAA